MLNRKKLVLELLILAVAVRFRLALSSIARTRTHRAHAKSAFAFARGFYFRGLCGFPGVARFGVSLQILAWAPRPQAEEEYAKFVQATGFDYERDLDRMGVSFSGSAQSPKNDGGGGRAI